MLRFRNPEKFISGNLSGCLPHWKLVLKDYPKASEIFRYVSEGVKVQDSFVPFKGTFRGCSYNADVPPRMLFPNSSSCNNFRDFVARTILERVANGSLLVWGEVGKVDPPHLVMPITVEPSKPRMCHDERFLNCWIKDCPFSLDYITDLPRYVSVGHYQTTLRGADSRVKTCDFCGRMHDVSKRENCPAFGKRCNKCNKQNHFANVCFGSAPKPSQRGSRVHYLEDEFSDEVFGVQEISAVTLNDSQLVTLKLESGNYLRFQPDTGAQCNVVPLHLYKKATNDFDLLNVAPVSTAIISYGGTSIPILGRVRLRVWRGDFRWCVGHYQTKSGYDHVRLHPSSSTFFGLEWEGWYFVYTTLPFGWKASAYLYHSIGLAATCYVRALGVPCSQYIDDRHNGQLRLPPSRTPSSFSGLQLAEMAAFIACSTFVSLGYFIGINWNCRQIPRLHLGFGETSFSAPARQTRQVCNLKRGYIES